MLYIHGIPFHIYCSHVEFAIIFPTAPGKNVSAISLRQQHDSRHITLLVEDNDLRLINDEKLERTLVSEFEAENLIF